MRIAIHKVALSFVFQICLVMVVFAAMPPVLAIADGTEASEADFEDHNDDEAVFDLENPADDNESMAQPAASDSSKATRLTAGDQTGNEVVGLGIQASTLQTAQSSDGYWVSTGAGWKYWSYSGYYLTNAWKADSVGWCYLGSDGVALVSRWAYLYDSSGWNWYYFTFEHISYNAFIRDTGGWCYVNNQAHALRSITYIRINDMYWPFEPTGFGIDNQYHVYYYHSGQYPL